MKSSIKKNLRKLKKTINSLSKNIEYRNKIQSLQEKISISPKNAFNNVILITIDCLRKDHMSLYGYNKSTTPFLEEISKNSYIFNNFFAASPWTGPAIVSIYTGLYPKKHGCGFFDEPSNFDIQKFKFNIKKEHYTLVDVFNSLGYLTYFDSGSIYPAEHTIISFFDKSNISNNATEIVDKALKFLEKISGEKVFVHLHFSDLHQPIYANEEFRTLFKANFNDEIRNWKFGNKIEPRDEFIKYKQEKLNLYNAALAYVDNEIKRFFVEYHKLINSNNDLFIITADHGEEFWDYFEVEKEYFYDPRKIWGIGHGHNLFSPVTNIPFIIYNKNLNLKIIDAITSQVDILPTILKLLNININFEYEFDGVDIFGLELENRKVFSESIAYGYQKVAVWDNTNKMIISKKDKIQFVLDYKKGQDEILKIKKL